MNYWYLYLAFATGFLLGATLAYFWWKSRVTRIWIDHVDDTHHTLYRDELIRSEETDYRIHPN